MIEVRCYPCGSIGWAEDEAAALVAARQLVEDDREHMPILGRKRSVTFHVDDALVLGPIPELAILNFVERPWS